MKKEHSAITSQEKLHAAIFIDDLTGVYSLHAFFLLAEQQLKIASRTRKWLSLLLTSVNHIQWIHDALGRRQVTQALVDTTTILRRTFRSSDIIGRTDDNEFAVLAIDAHHSSSNIVTTRLLHNIEDYNAKEKKLYRLSLSFGIAFYDPDHPCALDDLLARARVTML